MMTTLGIIITLNIISNSHDTQHKSTASCQLAYDTVHNTFSIITLSIKTLCIITLSMMLCSITFSIASFSRTVKK